MAQILFIDDDVPTLQLMAKAAEMLGHQAILCPSPREAYNLLLNHQIDVILVDQQLQEMDGSHLIADLRENSALEDIPVYLVSAFVSEEEQTLSREAGAIECLQKPLGLAELARIIPN